MAQIFPKKTTRDYMWILMSSFLLGQNIEQKFHIFTGTGANGKSVLIDLFEMCFGDYCVKLPVTLLTQKRAAAGAANPELARARPARFASMQEPSDKETMNIGFMKELTGGDKIMVRALYQEPFEFKPKFKLALCCNHLPKVPPNDEACWRRLRVVEFIAKFKDFPNPENPLEFQKDEFLHDKMYSWKEAFMYLLLQYYKKYRREGIREPDEVTKATEEYQKMCDIYVEFVMDTMEKHEDSTLKLEETFQAFRVWYRENFDGKCPSRREFKDGVAKKLGKYIPGRGGGWPGWRFIPQLDDEQEEQEVITETLSTTKTQPVQTKVVKKEVTVTKVGEEMQVKDTVIIPPESMSTKEITPKKLAALKPMKTIKQKSTTAQ
jgi:P4 family phage/plasmid primase-like protien